MTEVLLSLFCLLAALENRVHGCVSRWVQEGVSICGCLEESPACAGWLEYTCGY